MPLPPTASFGVPALVSELWSDAGAGRGRRWRAPGSCGSGSGWRTGREKASVWVGGQARARGREGQGAGEAGPQACACSGPAGRARVPRPPGLGALSRLLVRGTPRVLREGAELLAAEKRQLCGAGAGLELSPGHWREMEVCKDKGLAPGH